MKSISICIFLTISILTSAYTDEQRPTLPDSLLTIDYIYNYTFTDYTKSIEIAQLMRERKLEPSFKIDIAEGDLHYNNGKHHQALSFYTRALKSDSVIYNDERTMRLYHRFISCYEGLHNEPKKAEYIDKLLHKARAAGDLAMESIALFSMGRMIYYQNDKERGYRLIHEAIGRMENTDYEYKNDNLIYNYNTLYILQQMDADFEGALQTLDKLALVIGSTTDEDFNMEGINRKELKTMYAHRAFVLTKLNRKEEAAGAYAKWKEMGSINDKDNHLIIPYLRAIGQYDEVIRINKAREDFLRCHNDTINYHMTTLKRTTGVAYREKGDFKKASKYFSELAILIDSLKTREQQSAALELATVYETLEKEAEIQQKTAALHTRNLLLGSAALTIVLLAIMLWRNMRHARIIRKKNAVMVDTITQLMEYKNEEYAFKEAYTPPPGEPEIAMDNKALFDKLKHLIISDNLYLNNSLVREDLMKLIGVDKNKFAQIIKENTGTNITGYLNNLRLEYAVRLLKAHPEISINEVAEKCAIPNISTFYRVFKDKYGMTPVEFRDARTK